MSEEVDILTELIGSLGFYDISRDCIFSLFLHQELIIDDSLLKCVDNIISKNCLNEIISLLIDIRNKNEYNELWNRIRVNTGRTEDGKLFIPVIKYIYKNMDLQKIKACRMYIIILTISKFENVFIFKFFNSVIKQITCVQEIIKSSKQFSTRDVENINDITLLFDDLQYLITDEFIETAPPQVYSAILESAFSFSSIFRKDFIKKNSHLMEIVWNIIKIAMTINSELALPTVVTSLINETSKHNTANDWRNRLYTMVTKKLKSKEDILVLFVKHLLLRGSDNAAMREATSGCLQIVAPVLTNPKPLIDFLLTLSRAKTVVYRAQAATAASKAIYLKEPQNLALASASILYSLMEDPKGPVSSAAILGIAQVLKDIDLMNGADLIKMRIGFTDSLYQN